jgi:hypothetical protein
MVKRQIAAVFMLISFTMAIIITLITFYDATQAYTRLATELYISGFINLVVAVIIFLGSIYCLAGTSWPWALGGSIAATISIGILFIGSISGLIALILVVASKDEFLSLKTRPQPPPPPTMAPPGTHPTYGHDTMPGKVPPPP